MAQSALRDGDGIGLPSTMATAYTHHSTQAPEMAGYGFEQAQKAGRSVNWLRHGHKGSWQQPTTISAFGLNSTGKGILIGMLSAFGSAALVGIIIAVVYFFRYTNRGRIFLDRINRPGEFDDEQSFLREEEDALAEMSDLERAEYFRAKAFVQANPPESVQSDISLSQFLAIQEKGVSAWEFEPELEIANCFVEARTEIEFFDSECSVQSNLPMPKQNEVYYWEAKLYDKPESTLVSVGVTTKPYPLFRLPGLHKYSISYQSNGHRRFNQPFSSTGYGPLFVQGDVVGVGYRPRTGTIFFTRNGKKLEDVCHGMKLHNFFPTVGANGPASVHVNFGQMGFVFIEANVKKWGLAPMTGSLAPPPPYGSEAGSILLEGGREGIREGQGWAPGHGRTSSAQIRLQGRPTRSPGPERSPTDISLAQFNIMDVQEEEDLGEGTSEASSSQQLIDPGLPLEPAEFPPPDYESPEEEDATDSDTTPRASGAFEPDDEHQQLLRNSPPIPTYEAAMSDVEAGRGRSSTRTRPRSET
ncbi:hypothetical protein DOTSEDRAFT_69830 [Dothistroma septosporum NZE10]|uniref:Protein SSH4 n=1 Tax=Dothistroma septosporum (strain NZE10 / CBS 128990) TaxID=675120 RepID=N1PWW6_DOTSN|nr:hypothetical protein DOTSEDRAFT_69830 [Dothistroma septosporum NZE10]